MVRRQLMNTNPEPPARHGKNQVGMKTCSLGGAVAATETALIDRKFLFMAKIQVACGPRVGWGANSMWLNFGIKREHYDW